MRPVVLRWLSVALLVTGPACVALLHVISRDLAPRSRRLSEYANGPYGYVMTLAFVALGAGLLVLAAAMHAQRGRHPSARHVPEGIAIAGIGMVMSGIVATDPSSANSMREAVHSQASGLATVALVASALLWLARDRWRAPRVWSPSAAGAAFACVAAALAVASPWLHRSTWTGLSQRALWVALLGWLFAVVVSLRSVPAPRLSEDVSAVSAGIETIDV